MKEVYLSVMCKCVVRYFKLLNVCNFKSWIVACKFCFSSHVWCRWWHPWIATPMSRKQVSIYFSIYVFHLISSGVWFRFSV